MSFPMFASSRNFRPRIATALAALVTVVCSLVVVGTINSPSALAHADISGSTPADGETLTSAPGRVEVEFNEPLIDAGAALVVTGPDGSIVSGAKPTIKGRKLSAEVSGAPGQGKYSVAYRVVSEDGHAVKGRYTFFVEGAQADSQPTAVPATNSPMPTEAADTPSVNPSPPVTTSATEADAAGSPWFLLAIGALVAVAIVVGIAFVRRRST